MRRQLLTICSALVLLLALVGVVSAAIPHSSTKVFVACMDSSGKLRVIDHQAGRRCSSREKTLSWNQRGPVGPQGAPGATGEQGPEGEQGAEGEPGEQGPPGTTNIPVVTLPRGSQQYDGQDIITIGPFTFRAECWRESSTVWRAGWYVKTSAEHSLVDVQNGYTLEPTDNYHVDGMIVNDFGQVTDTNKWVPAELVQGVGPDGTSFSAHLWLGFNVLGSTANECQFGGTIAH